MLSGRARALPNTRYGLTRRRTAMTKESAHGLHAERTRDLFPGSREGFHRPADPPAPRRVSTQQAHEGERWKVIPVIEEVKAKAKAAGLWNFFMPPHSGQTPCRRQFRVRRHAAHQPRICAVRRGDGQDRLGVAKCFNCSAPDTGNMEVFHRYGTREQKEQWLKPLMNGEIRSAFLMTEPAVASSDATNIETRDGARRRPLCDQRHANGGRRASAIRAARSRS